MASGDPCHFMDGKREIIPRAYSFIGEMVDSGVPYGRLNHDENSPSQVCRIGWCANLVKYDS